MMTKKALVAIANGSEDIEAVTLIDVLRRAKAEVTVAAVDADDTLQIVAARGTKIVADRSIESCANEEWHLIALPGGMPGSQNLADNPALDKLIRHQLETGGIVGAICAAPAVVLGSKGLLQDRSATGHPNFHKQLNAGIVDVEARVLVDGNLVTSQGPGTALEFALALVERLFGVVKREEVASPMVLHTSVQAYY